MEYKKRERCLYLVPGIVTRITRLSRDTEQEKRKQKKKEENIKIGDKI